MATLSSSGEVESNKLPSTRSDTYFLQALEITLEDAHSQGLEIPVPAGYVECPACGAINHRSNDGLQGPCWRDCCQECWIEAPTYGGGVLMLDAVNRATEEN